MDTVKHFIPSGTVSHKKATPPVVTGAVRCAFRRRNRARHLVKRSSSAETWCRFRKCRMRLLHSDSVQCKYYGYSTTPDVPLPPLSEIACDWTDVVKAIQHLKHNITSGPDGILAIMLHVCYSSICNHLACLFNASLSSGKVPSAWKISNVTPIHKKGDASVVQNYRPISLLSLVGKLQERIIHNVLDHLLGTGAISLFQFGVRPCS